MVEDILEEPGTEEVSDSVDTIEEAREADLDSEYATAGVEREATEPLVEKPVAEGAGDPKTDQITQLQKDLTTRTTELYRLQNKIQQALPLLRQVQRDRGESPKKIDPEEFLKAFVKDPEGVFRYMFGGLSKTELDPIRGELSASKRDSAINAFMRDHPELGVEGEEKLGRILDANPHLTNLGPNAPVARVRSALEDALGRLIAEDPSGYAASIEAAKTGGDQSIIAAKAAASGLGNKKGSVTTTPSERDEFDAVLDLSTSTKDRYNAGVER